MNNENIFGYGWSLPIPKIERKSTHGSAALYDYNNFNSTLSGDLEAADLSDSSHGAYGAKVDDGSFLQYEYNANETWTVTDKLGTIYTFGDDITARLEHPTDSDLVAAWYLTEVRDTNDNTVTYSYTKNNHQIYPENINYTGHGANAGLFDVSFSLEARDDDHISYATGFPVTTSSVISQIDVKEDGEIIRSYELDHSPGDNGSRSLLTSITESGTDANNTTITKPATEFTYSESARTWTEDESFTFPLAIGNAGSGSLAVYVFDVNGDSLPDVVKATQSVKQVFINNGDYTWTEDSSYTIPFSFVSSGGKDLGIRIADINGDGFQDILQSRNPANGPLSESVYLNDGGTGWTQSSSIHIPIAFTNDGGSDFGVRVFDVNADGLPDIIKAKFNSDSSIDSSVYLNDGDGTGWTEVYTYTFPRAFVTSNGLATGLQAHDVNGDGLSDLIHAKYSSSGLEQHVYIQNGAGTGWAEDTGYSFPRGFLSTTGKDTGVRMIDVNVDGLLDVLYARNDSSGTLQDELYINNGDGTGWTEDSSFTAPVALTNDGGSDLGAREDDFGGQMKTDILYSRMDSEGNTWTDRLFVANGNRSDLLTTVESPVGGTTTVTYSTSVAHNSNLFFPLQVVDSITTNDGLGNTSTTSYLFEDGAYYYSNEYDRKFAGFGKVTTTDGLGNVTVDFYHQGNSTDPAHGEETDDISKLWHRYRQEQYNDSDDLYRVTIDAWDNTDLGDDRDFVYKTQTLVMDYDGNAGHRDTAIAYTYDTASGNLDEKVEYGIGAGDDDGSFTDSGTDDRTTTYAYAQWTSSESGYLVSETLKDHNDDTVRQTTMFYDENTDDAVDVGNITKEVKWISSTAEAETNFSYDTYGFRTEVIDANGNTTTINPDAEELYPAMITNDLSQTTEYVYDYSSGKVIETTDANGFVSETVLDGFDRPVTEKKPNPSSPTSLQNVRTFAYDDASFPSSVHESAIFDGSISKEIYTYFDGFGRPVQKREEAASNYNVIDTAYDERGDIKKISLPYSSSGTSHTTSTTTADLYETYTRDALRRLTSKTNAAGSTTTDYDDGVSTETDAENNAKEYHWDGFGRLKMVVEVIDSTELETSYEYDVAGNLTGLTDAENNLRSFAYNGLGNRTAMTDLHASGDNAYGSWSYEFDAMGNMIESVSPNSVTTTYVYDELNRLETENATGTGGTDLTYTYDSCANGVGKQCSSAVLGGAATAYTYDALGRTATEVKTISTVSYTTGYAYDRQGNVSTVTYPDTSTASYTLNSAGQITSAAFDDVHGSGPETQVSSIAYGPHGKVTAAIYGNGVTSSWSYDSAELYRLQNKTTTSGTDDIEDFTYSYDNVGNLETLADASSLYDSMALAYGYDDLYRLTDADSVSSDETLDYIKTWSYTDISNIDYSSDKGSYTYGGSASGNYANPHAVTGVGGDTLTYDPNGNMTADGTWTNTWDYRNQLLSSTDGTTHVTYQYDDAGNRVLQDGSGATRIYPNSYYSVDGANVDRHILVGALGSVATSTWDTTDATVIYHHTDHLGGTHVETDESGDAVEYIIYSPFGGTLADVKTGAYENKNKYTGKEKDEDTGWYYYGARYYDAERGVFLSEDPVFLTISDAILLQDPQHLNSYAYSRNNPVSYIDPDGRDFTHFLNRLNSTLDFGANIASLGGWGFAKTIVSASSVTMSREGVTPHTVAYMAGSVIAGTGASAAGAFVNGVTLGTIAIEAGTINRSIGLRLDNASGKTINGRVTVPKDWTKSPSDTGNGYKYTDPKNPVNEIRLMPGSPDAKFPVSQSPYMRVRTEGGYTDVSGKVSSDQATTHHPISSIK